MSKQRGLRTAKQKNGVRKVKEKFSKYAAGRLKK